MIVKTARGFEVKAKSGRTMGVYTSKKDAEKRLKQLEVFKVQAKKRFDSYRKKNAKKK